MMRFWQPTQIIGSTEITDEAQTSQLVPADAAVGVAGATTAGSPRYSASRSVTEAVAGATTAGTGANAANPEVENTARPSGRHILMAVAPYLIIIAVFSIAQIPPVATWLTANVGRSFRWPPLNVVSSHGKAVAAEKFTFSQTTGTLLLVSGLATMALYKVSAVKGWRIYKDGVYALRWTIVTVSLMLALSYVMNLSGQTTTMGLALAATGAAFAVLSPVLGWIGTALTGSDTSSNALFGNLQVTAATQTGLSPVLMAVSNSTAGALGKMVSLQNLAVAAAAASLVGGENILFRKMLWWSLALLALLAGFILLQSTSILGWMVP
jgi:lactate permease